MGHIYTPDRQLIVPTGALPYDGRPSPYIGIGGRYKFHIQKAKSGTVVLYDHKWRKNLVTNQGLLNVYQTPPGLFAPSQLYCSNCVVGTGNTTPQVTDTQLVNQVASVAIYNPDGSDNPTTQSYVPAAGSVPPYWINQAIFQYNTGAAVGNLSEIGTFPNQGVATALTTRALIVDSNGNPTTITVLSNEILTVTYQMLYYLQPADTAFSFNVNGSPVTGVYRLMNMTSPPGNLGDGVQATNNTGEFPVSNAQIYIYSGAMGTNTDSPSGSSAEIVCYTSNTTQNFTNDIANSGTCWLDINAVTFPIGSGNYGGGIASFAAKMAMFQYQFGNLSSNIMKTSSQQLSMGFRFIWGRYSS